MNVEDIFVVDSADRALELLAKLQAVPGPFGCDVETVDCDPKKQSPVHTARIVCFTVAWREDGATRAAFVWAEHMPAFKAWLEDPAVHKIGARFPGYDMHCFENHGIRIAGFVHDNVATSRLWYSSKDVAHDLKSQAETVLGYRTRSFKQLFSRARENKPKVYKKDAYKPLGLSKKGPLAGVPALVIAGAVSTFSYAGKLPLVPLDRIREDHASLVPTLISYATEDAVWSLELAEKREAQLATRPAKFGSTLQLYNDVWNPMLLMLNRMERAGIAVDSAECARIEAAAQADMDALLPEIRAFAGDDEFNPGSSDQMRTLLKDKYSLRRPPIKGTMFAINRSDKDEWSTSEASLHGLQIKHPEHNAGLDLIRRWRKTRRNMQFGRDIPRFTGPDGRVHTVIGPEADTGRLSAKLPALQQIPSKNDTYGIRGAFVAAPGHRLVVADFSQLEVYVLAHMLVRLFGDTTLKDALATGDVYSWIARECFAEVRGLDDAAIKARGKRFRDLSKIIVLAKNYGKSTMGMALTLLDELGEPADEGFCQGLFDTFDRALPAIPRWQRWIADYAKRHRGVPTLLGRWRPLPLAGTNRGDRQALNSPIQGGAADIATLAMLNLNTYDLGLERAGRSHTWFAPGLAATGAKCLLQIHDELIFEVPENNAADALSIIEYGMTHLPMLDLAVQLKVEAKVAQTWKGGK